MANQQSLSPFQEVHKKIQEARERARKERERADALRRESSENEANARASTVPEEETLPHLVADGNLQRCSVCGYPFPADVRPSMAVAFPEHLMKGHLPGQTRENV